MVLGEPALWADFWGGLPSFLHTPEFVNASRLKAAQRLSFLAGKAESYVPRRGVERRETAPVKMFLRYPRLMLAQVSERAKNAARTLLHCPVADDLRSGGNFVTKRT